MADPLRIKMRVHSVLQSSDEKGDALSDEIILRPVNTHDGAGNGVWEQYVPIADFRLVIKKPELLGKAQRGQFFYLELTPTTVSG